MKEFLVRIGLVAHWTGFCFGVLTLFLGIAVGVTNTGREDAFFGGTAGFFVFTAGGWLLRWILTGGQVNFLPYKNGNNLANK